MSTGHDNQQFKPHTRSAWFFGVLVFAAFSLILWRLASVARDPSIVLCFFSLQTIGVLFFTGRFFSFSHPLVFFPLFFYFYSSWYAFYLLTSGSAYDFAVLVETQSLAILGLLAFFIAAAVVACPQPGVGPSLACDVRRVGVNTRFFSGLGNLAAVGASLGFVAVAASGFANKQDVLSNGGLSFVLATYLAWLANAMALLCFTGTRDQQRQRIPSVVLSAALMGILGYLCTGERDHLLRLFLAMAILVADTRSHITVATVVLMAAFIPLIVTFSGMFKAALLSGHVHYISHSNEDFFTGEFVSAGRNLYELHRRGVEPSWSFFLTDLARGMLPPGFGAALLSATAWFHNIYRVDMNFAGSSGWGLGLIPEGYICGGELGIVVVMGFVGALLALLYRARNASLSAAVFYALAATSAVYCIRADIANFISMVFKLGLVAVYAPAVLNALLSFRQSRKLGCWPRSRLWMS